ncbi:Zona pellucida sperm-binding protein 4 [Nibea albiflora]|uniref:Zona pellucida sperm-binding protein 4 n=1 Tax=Nibea albiflora TaxID=240163 RepID=A0ACB7FEU5_NIBAL|nr:Zona pellucida sperm-binding protein 4 [Nibea albiflora]
MGKYCSAPSLIALALLGCLLHTEVEAQGWQKPAAKGSPSPQAPQAPRPSSPKAPQYPQPPQVPRPSPPKENPYVPKVQPAAPPKYPHFGQDYGYSQQEQQVVPQTPSKSSDVKQHHVHSCEVAENTRVPCGGPDISAAGCEAINCCFNDQKCYFGKAVTVQCTKDAQFIVVVARDVTVPRIDLEKISLLGQGQHCTHVDTNSAFAIYQFPVTACGSVVTEEPGVISYMNRMSASYEIQDGDLGSITRDSDYDLLFECRYIGTSVETVVTEVWKITEPPLPVAALGPVRWTAAYTSYYTEADYPVTKVLREPVYVEVQLLEKTDPLLVLTLGHCWTTTSPTPHSLPQWDILIDGCPYRDDRYLSSLVPVGMSSGLDFPSHYRRFMFKMFTFVDPNSMEPMREQVYIHCSTAICAAAPGRNCEPSCLRRKRDIEAAEEKKAEPKVVVSVGPVIIAAPEQPKSV